MTFSKALDAPSVMRSASSITTTCHRPSEGSRAAVATTVRISATEIDRPSGTTRRTSGCVPASTVRQAEQTPQPGGPSPMHCKAAASARAATDRPDPAGPVNSQAWLIDPAATDSPAAIWAAAAAALCRVATVSACPTSPDQTLTPRPSRPRWRCQC